MTATATLNTLLLDTVAWDCVLDASGNIAMAKPPYATVQDVASAVKVFLAEVYYDTKQGVQYFPGVLGAKPPLGILKSMIEQAALTVPGVLTAKCVINSIIGRNVAGQIVVTTIDGIKQTIALGSGA